jgi:hypothetical protein
VDFLAGAKGRLNLRHNQYGTAIITTTNDRNVCTLTSRPRVLKKKVLVHEPAAIDSMASIGEANRLPGVTWFGSEYLSRRWQPQNPRRMDEIRMMLDTLTRSLWKGNGPDGAAKARMRLSDIC